MKLSRFITTHMEQILEEWEAFAKEIPTTSKMSISDLRDHAKQMLQACAADLDTWQSAAEQASKSKGEEAVPKAGTAAIRHGLGRLESGYSVAELISEFRALRASVLRLWQSQVGQVTEATTDDMVRFNETIDQALAESATAYSQKATHTREIFLAILGHDLRGPLATMAMAGDYLTHPDADLARAGAMGARVKTSAALMTSMVRDLLEYSRTQLGSGIPVVRRRADMRDIGQAALDDASAANPRCRFELEVAGQTAGSFDAARMQQVLTNLLNNAAQYRTQSEPVTLRIEGSPDAVLVQVGNHGEVIPRESLASLFDPLVRLARDGQEDEQPNINLGLGLFIAREITVAHGGSIVAASDEDAGTVFSVRIPREA
ncbi:sensor histidine kinase [Cognatiluteimonas telluris]|jgi:signal transduction histidine kinase|uniref:sensor histidine kinase n=1 Tax=Cognatiluteimonas telluris TaxID=1104775 RepID=UPI00140B287C|nr:sensor histidine kinase [Lysobacter telluris]